MRVNRRFLYWGVFLVALGGVLVVVDLGAIAPAVIVDVLRLWPLALVAIGLGLVLRRTRFSVPGGMLAAAAPGLLLGGRSRRRAAHRHRLWRCNSRTDDLARIRASSTARRA